MKNFFSVLKSLAVVATLGLATLAVSCGDPEEQKPVNGDSFERVEALEERLSEEVALLEALCAEDNALISCVRNAESKWEVAFADGSSFEVAGDANSSLYIIEENGVYYWAQRVEMVQPFVDADGNKIEVGELFVYLNAEGSVKVSFDNGENLILVSGDVAVFENVQVVNNKVVFTLLGGSTITKDLPANFYFEVGNNLVLFNEGEQKSTALAEGVVINNAEVFAVSAGWEAEFANNTLTVTAPTEAEVAAGNAVRNGVVSVLASLEGGQKVVGNLNVRLGVEQVLSITEVSHSWNSVVIDVLIAGYDKYQIYMGKNGDWVSVFEDWQFGTHPTDDFEFGWSGTKYQFTGSLFEYAKSPYKSSEELGMPGTTYELVILPLVEGKDRTEYTVQDLHLFNFTTDAASNDSSYTPVYELIYADFEVVEVKVTADNAYATKYKFYNQTDYSDIKDNVNFIRRDVIQNGAHSTEPEFVVRESGRQGAKFYLAAVILDKDGCFGDLVIEEFQTKQFEFSTEMTLTLGEITSSPDGRTTYLPITAEGGEVDHYRVFMTYNSTSWINMEGGLNFSNPDAVARRVAQVPNEYYGADFVYPNELQDGKIVMSGTIPNKTYHIVIVAKIKGTENDFAGGIYAQYTPVEIEAGLNIVYKNTAGYNVDKPVCEILSDEVSSDATYLRLSVEPAANTTVYVFLGDDEYYSPRTASEFVEWMIEYPYTKVVTEDEICLFDRAEIYNGCNFYVVWMDGAGAYHEAMVIDIP